jgi:hypothetical protein
MAKRNYRTVSVEVDLDEFDDDCLIDELEARGLLTKQQAESIQKKAAQIEDCDQFDIDQIELEKAVWRLQGGNIREALHCIENAIPSLRGIADERGH